MSENITQQTNTSIIMIVVCLWREQRKVNEIVDTHFNSHQIPFTLHTHNTKIVKSVQ